MQDLTMSHDFTYSESNWNQYRRAVTARWLQDEPLQKPMLPNINLTSTSMKKGNNYLWYLRECSPTQLLFSSDSRSLSFAEGCWESRLVCLLSLESIPYVVQWCRIFQSCQSLSMNWKRMEILHLKLEFSCGQLCQMIWNLTKRLQVEISSIRRSAPHNATSFCRGNFPVRFADSLRKGSQVWSVFVNAPVHLHSHNHLKFTNSRPVVCVCVEDRSD